MPSGSRSSRWRKASKPFQRFERSLSQRSRTNRRAGLAAECRRAAANTVLQGSRHCWIPEPVKESTMPDGEYGLVAPAPAGSVSPSALADSESVSRIERNESTILSDGDARFAGRDTLLQGPIASRLIGLALPILIVLAVQTLVSVAETYFVGFLGDDALAGVALVFPILMLMTMMSNGGIGGGVASAVARAIGAGRMRDAEALMGHSVVIAVAFGAVFTAADLRLGTVSALWRRRCRARDDCVLRHRNSRAGCVPAFATHAHSACPHAHPLASCERHSRCGDVIRGWHRRRQSYGRIGNGIRRRLWRRCNRGLRYGVAPRLSAHPSVVRARHRIVDDGRHQRGRGPDAARAAHRLDRGVDLGGRDGTHRTRRCTGARWLDSPLQRFTRSDSSRRGLSSSRCAVLCLLRLRHGALFREPRSRQRALAVHRRLRASCRGHHRRLVLDHRVAWLARRLVLDHRRQLGSVRRC
ncbi:MAG: hypothetical protein E6G78_10180, partial [Alphaproteobacteria bacterium]